MKVQDILKSKSTEVFTIHADQSVYEAARLLAAKNIGALIVVDDGGAPVGIISERDIVRQIAKKKTGAMSVMVGDVMTSEVVIVLPDDDIGSISATMTNQRIRHLPVMDGGQLAGIISIGDVVKARLDFFEGEVRTLQHYITGDYA